MADEFEYISHAASSTATVTATPISAKLRNPSSTVSRERSVSITALRKDRQWPRRSTTSWPRSRA